ncbi:MAG TPA: FAD-dependent oxidoreductase [Nocardioidaceae bacterium]
MTSIWMDRPGLASHPPLTGDATYDVAVVGGGLTGLVTAVLFARSGRRVVLLEARRLAAVTTGNTTGKISLLQGTKLSRLAKRHPADVVRAYVDAGREGQQWLLRYCDEHGVAVQTRPAYTYATTAEGEQAAREELETARRAGLDAEWVETTALPFDVRGAVRLADQAQFDPMDVVAALADDLVERSGVIHEESPVTSLRRGDGGVRIAAPTATERAETVVVATGTPIFDRGGYFARLEPDRSYAVAFRSPGTPPAGMYLSADTPTRSLRSYPREDGEYLLAGGNGHVVGRRSATTQQYDDLVRWTESMFPGAQPTHRWSAQDYRSVDGLPYVGPLTPGHDDVLVATGYDKWGMTTAVAAALALSARVLGGQTPWADAMDSWRLRELGGLPTALRLNASVALHLASGYLQAFGHGGSEIGPAEGEGRVFRRAGRPTAACRVDGVTHELSAVCPHLGGILTWNDAERSWDCPLHGSRFAADGTRLEGPATKGLPPAVPA